MTTEEIDRLEKTPGMKESYKGWIESLVASGSIPESFFPMCENALGHLRNNGGRARINDFLILLSVARVLDSQGSEKAKEALESLSV